MTVAYARSKTVPQGLVPYLTLDEYRRAPSGVDASALVTGDADANRAELANVIRRASSWIDQHCNQVLAATEDTEAGRLTVGRDGLVRVHPRFTPLCLVSGFSYGAAGQDLTAIEDFSRVWVEDATFVVPLLGGTTWRGPLEFGASPSPGGTLYARWTYVSGFPNTLLAATATAGDTSILVEDGTGIVPGRTQFTIYDGATTETVVVDDTYTHGSTTVPLAGALVCDHSTVGVSVSALPEVVKQAAVLVTSALIKTRSASAIVMGGMKGGASGKAPANVLTLDEMNDVTDMLQPFCRVR